MASSNLVALWEAHCRYEFETRDVDATMATMARWAESEGQPL